RGGYGPRMLGRKARRLVLLARDQDGHQSLCHIITRRRGAIEPVDHDPVRCLDAAPRGGFLLSDDASVPRGLARAGGPAGALGFLLIRPGSQPPPADFAVVADPDVIMAGPGDRNLHRLQVAIRRQQPFAEVTDAEPAERSLPPPARLRWLYRD